MKKYTFKIIRTSNGKTTHAQQSDDVAYKPTIPKGWDLEGNHTIEIVNNSQEILLRECYKKRRKGYGSIRDQLDEIYHDIDAWRLRIKGVKDENVKP